MKQVFFAILFGIMGTIAGAHSPLAVTEPADEAIIAKAPETLQLQFKSDIRLTRVTVVYQEGDAVDLDLAEQTSFTTDHTLTFPDLGAGTYVITWRGLASDGHAQNGTFGFVVK